MQDNKITTELDKVLSGAPKQAGGARAVSFLSGGSDEGGGTEGAGATGRTTLAETIAQNTSQLIQVRGSLQSQLDSMLENTRALIESTTKAQSGGSKAAGAASSMANSILGGGILGPIVSGLLGLFGRGDNAEAPGPLVKFALPTPVRVDAGFQGGAPSLVDYGQNDKPRAAGQAAAPQITVNVSAMDSRSFLDHSSDIASAVRQALLESNALNDVIGEM